MKYLINCISLALLGVLQALLGVLQTLSHEVGDDIEVVEVLEVLGLLLAQDDAQKRERVFDVVGELAVREAHDVRWEIAIVWIVRRKRLVDDLEDAERVVDELFHFVFRRPKKRKKRNETATKRM
jgi:hypothetical protein